MEGLDGFLWRGTSGSAGLSGSGVSSVVSGGRHTCGAWRAGAPGRYGLGEGVKSSWGVIGTEEPVHVVRRGVIADV